MKLFTHVILHLLLWVPIGHAKHFYNEFIEFQLPENWNCQVSNFVLCSNMDSNLGREAWIEVSADEISISRKDEFDSLKRKFSAPLVMSIDGLRQVTPTKTQVRIIAGNEWIESLYPEAERKEFFAYYLATVQDDLRIVFRFSANDYEKYFPIIQNTVPTIRVYRIPKSLESGAAIPWDPEISKANSRKVMLIMAGILLALALLTAGIAYPLRQKLNPWILFAGGALFFFPALFGMGKYSYINRLVDYPLVTIISSIFSIFMVFLGAWVCIYTKRLKAPFALASNLLVAIITSAILWEIMVRLATPVTFPGVMEGRPRRRGKRKALAQLRISNEWHLSSPEMQGTPGIPPRMALAEHASVASFADLTRDLLDAGAPPTLVLRAIQAAKEEIEHAKIAFTLSKNPEVGPLGPGPIKGKYGGWRHKAQLARLAIESFEDGCVNEARSVDQILAMAQLVVDPQPRTILNQVAADERGHEDLAWKIVRWTLSELLSLNEQRLASRVLELMIRRAQRIRGTDPKLADRLIIQLNDLKQYRREEKIAR